MTYKDSDYYQIPSINSLIIYLIISKQEDKIVPVFQDNRILSCIFPFVAFCVNLTFIVEGSSGMFNNYHSGLSHCVYVHGHNDTSFFDRGEYSSRKPIFSPMLPCFYQKASPHFTHFSAVMYHTF